jgi:hypothetical protein
MDRREKKTVSARHRWLCIVLSAGLVALAASSCLSVATKEAKLAAATAASGKGVVQENDPKADPEKGRIYGEFEDLGFFEKTISKKPEMAAWSDKDVWDGLSGATIQSKTMGPEVPDRMVLLDEKIIAYTDGFGQFWVALPPGAYSLVGRCDGYEDGVIKIDVKPQSVNYANFYLRKKRK